MKGSKLGGLMGMVNKNQNPMNMVMQFLMGGNQDPKMMEAWNKANSIAKGKGSKEIENMVMNMAKEQGVDINQLQQMMQQFSKKQ